MTEKLSSRREMELQMDGRLPLERQHPKKGESQWYYVDPRGRSENFTLLSEAKTIDVPTKDTPNPYLQDIMREEADKNPENYYIWRTVGDDRVRSSHEERGGEIFAWDEPPEGGHPGEDYNCRCTAEPYVPGKKNEKQKRTSDAELIARNIKRLIKEEGNYPYPYKDTKGIITTANGKNINSYEKFRSLGWEDKNGNKASDELIQENYKRLQKAPAGNYTANFYKQYTEIRLSQEEINKITEEHLQSDLDFIRKHVSNFDNYPKEIQDIIIDIQYNTGDIRKFPLFLKAVEDKELDDMVKQSHRKDVSKNRNNGIKDMLMGITDWDY